MTCVRSVTLWSPCWVAAGLVVGGCAPESRLDTDSPWPADPENRTVEPLVEVVPAEYGPEISGGDTGAPEPQTGLTAYVEGDEVIVAHSSVLLSPCGDLSVALAVWEGLQVVSGAYTNNDCATAAGMYSVDWRFPVPETAGEWHLRIESAETVFTVE